LQRNFNIIRETHAVRLYTTYIEGQVCLEGNTSLLGKAGGR